MENEIDPRQVYKRLKEAGSTGLANDILNGARSRRLEECVIKVLPKDAKTRNEVEEFMLAEVYDARQDVLEEKLEVAAYKQQIVNSYSRTELWFYCRKLEHLFDLYEAYQGKLEEAASILPDTHRE